MSVDLFHGFNFLLFIDPVFMDPKDGMINC